MHLIFGIFYSTFLSPLSLGKLWPYVGFLGLFGFGMGFKSCELVGSNMNVVSCYLFVVV